MVLLFIGYNVYINDFDFRQGLFFSLLILLLFVCVVMHEYGHALMARYFGVGTRDIILSPIGGVARLEQMPRKPTQELSIAIAGPLVNVAIAIVLAVALAIVSDSGYLPIGQDLALIDVPVEFIKMLMFTNIALFLFNLVPAFPMDGGRLLRAFLALWLKWPTATKIAAILGRVLAVGFLIFGYWQGAYSLILIGIFIYFTAGKEWSAIRHEEYITTTSIDKIMYPISDKLGTESSYEQIMISSDKTKTNLQIIFDNFDQPIGYVDTEEILMWRRNEPSADFLLMYFVQSRMGKLSHDSNILDGFKYMRSNRYEVSLVYQNHQLLGLITREGITEHL